MSYLEEVLIVEVGVGSPSTRKEGSERLTQLLKDRWTILGVIAGGEVYHNVVYLTRPVDEG